MKLLKMRELTYSIIINRLYYFKGNRTKTARSLGIAIRTITQLIRGSSFALRPGQTKYHESFDELEKEYFRLHKM